ncbi:MAG: 1,4-beta-xylanase, partial [Alistipes sp.]|nr:1,4-beta-xylanase [Alistipes sp.]
MKKLFCVIVFAVLAISASAQQIFMGEAKANQLLLADPFILEDDGWYYIYGTHAADCIVVYRSKDLKKWSDRCGNAKNKLALHKDDVWV